MRLVPGQLLRLVRRLWWLLLLGPLIFGAIAFGISSRQSPQYRATTTLLINPESPTEALDYNAILASQNLAPTYSELVRIEPVLAAVIAELRLPESVNALKQRISTSTELQSLIINVSVTDEDPQRAAAIADAIGRHAGEYIASTAMPELVVADPASVPSAPFAPRVPFSTLLGLLLGLLVAGGGVILLELATHGVRTPAA